MKFSDLKPVKIEYKSFDLTKRDLTELTIKRSSSGNCYITDGTDNFSGFILCSKTDTQTICDVGFYPSSKSGLYIPRLTFYKTRLKTGEVKTAQKPEKVIISFSGSDDGVDELWKMIWFLSSFKGLVDLGEFDGKYQVAGMDDIVVHLKDLGEVDRMKEIIEYAQKSGVNPEDLAESAVHVNRKKKLELFKKMLNKPETLENYKQYYKEEIKAQGEEPIWHHFLKNNDWILGLNLEIKFIQEFTDEVSVGNPDTENQDNPKSDMMGITDYTVLIEFKKPSTDIFTLKKTSDARAGTWSFTNEFIEGFSQCLSQKFYWDKGNKTKDLTKDGTVISQDEVRTLDPKTIYIVGNKSREFPFDSRDKDTHIKRDTFQRFRRNNRNIEIITYDELYERANFIVNGKIKNST